MFDSLISETVIYGAVATLLVYLICLLLSTTTSFFSGYFDNGLVVHPHLNGVYYSASYWTEKGGRPYQEDRFAMIKGSGHNDSSLYALFDGHGGSKAAQYCEDHLLKYIQSDVNFGMPPKHKKIFYYQEIASLCQ